MKNYTTVMLEYWLRDVLIRVRQGRVRCNCDGGIRLIEGEEEELPSGYLYIGSGEVVEKILLSGRAFPEPLCLIASGLCGAIRMEELPTGLTLLEVGLPLLTLYNRVHRHIHDFRIWRERLQQIVYTNGGLQALLEIAAEELHAAILLVNAGYKYIAAVYDPSNPDPTAEELRENGYQSFETIQAIHHEKAVKWGPEREYVEYVSSISNNYTIVRLIRHHKDLIARLCVILRGPALNDYYADLNEILAEYVAEYMVSDQGADYGGNAEFGVLAADLIENRITGQEELDQRLKQIKLATRRYYHVMVIAFDEKENRMMIPWNYLINQLEYIFPFSNITTYKGQILLVIRKMKRGKRLVFDQEALMKILEDYDGYACIGNTSEFLISLPPVYHQAQDGLRIGRVMDPEKRLYYYEDYSVYQIIEMASEAGLQRLGSRNLVHLCNNEIIALLMYDRKNGTNLVEALQVYLENEHNTTKSAAALFIHRNTMLYKVHKIEEVIAGSLDEPMLRERLMFGCRVLEYMRRYRHENILELKRATAENHN